MASVKTTARASSPAAFIKQVDGEQRRKDCRALAAFTGHPPKLWGTSIVGFDRYRYKYASALRALIEHSVVVMRKRHTTGD